MENRKHWLAPAADDDIKCEECGYIIYGDHVCYADLNFCDEYCMNDWMLKNDHYEQKAG
jgi:hypothetical protein